MPDAVFIVAGQGFGAGRILYLNSEALRMFGYERDELLDESIEQLVPQSLRERHQECQLAYAEHPHRRHMGAAGLSLLGRRRDGSEFPIDVLLNPHEDAIMRVTVATVRDMTDRKQLEDELTRAKDAAVQANEVKSRFLAAASHDLRQPLQTIWTLQAVLARAFEKTEYAPHLALLEEAVRNMDQMLSTLVDINRLEVGAIQPVVRDFSLQEVLPRLRSEFGYSAASKSLTLDIEASAEYVHSDSMLLPVILRNLIGNAIKYTREGSVRLRVRTEATELYIDIIDSGVGIPRQHLRRLFDAFYQVDNPRREACEGVGLGLSIVQTVCQLLEHTVTIESREGKGSIFTVQLPRGKLPEMPLEVLELPVLVESPIGGALKVLHIEDDPGVARSMALLLRLEGYEVFGAATREEALQHVEVYGLQPDLIMSDFQLPQGYRGDEIVAEIVAKLGCKPPTIMLTGDTANKHVERAKVIADCILPKPVDVNRLLREMERLFAMSLRP